MSNVKWTDEQLCCIKSRGSSLLVSAAAGSGKTAVLVERLVRRIVEEGLDITQFLIITYTKAAAAELRKKICEALYKYAAQNVGDRHIRRQLVFVDSARISTVHSFCSWVLKTYSVKAEFAEGFRILEEAESKLIMEELLSELLEEKYDEKDAAFLELASFFSDGRGDKGLAPTVLELYSKSISHPYPERWLAKVEKEYEDSLSEGIEKTIWGEYAIEKAKSEIDFAKYLTEAADAFLAEDPEAKERYATFMEREKELVKALCSCDSWDELYSAVTELAIPSLPSSKGISENTAVGKIKSIHASIKEIFERIKEKYIIAPSAELCEEMRFSAPVVKGLTELVNELRTRFSEEKLRLRALDYSDLEHYAIELLVEKWDEENDIVFPSPTAKKISATFSEILLDEFQDSNNLQDMIFRAVSREEKNIVMVGDVKQSIYGFRLADPTVFLKKFKSFKAYDEAGEDEPRKVILSKNFRSRPEVLDAVNAFFSYLMTEKLGGIDYTDDQRLIVRDGMQKREGMEAEFCLVDEKGLNKSEIHGEARFVAEKIASLVAERFEIDDKDGNRRPVRYGDFAILLRSASTKAGEYEEELGRLGIPYISPREDDLLSKSEVTAVMSFLSVIDNPTSDVPLLATLRSPMFGFDADDICRIRAAHNGEIIRAVEITATGEDETAKKCKEFLELLSHLRAFARGRSASELIWELFNRTNALGMFGALSHGKERQENLLKFCTAAEGFESSGYYGLHRFISHVANLVQNKGKIPVSASSAGDAVTIMTVHKSKGLEFPVVFFANSIYNFNVDDIKPSVLIHPRLGIGMRCHDEENNSACSTLAREVIASAIREESKSEEMRILYVALTRAREKLFIVGSSSNAVSMIEKTVKSEISSEVDRWSLSNGGGTQRWFMLPLLRKSASRALYEYAGLNFPAREDGKWIRSGVFSYADESEAEVTTEEEHAEKGASCPDVGASRLFDFEYPYEVAISVPSKITATAMSSIKREKKIARKRPPRPQFIRERSLSAAERGTALHMAMQFVDFEKCITLDGAEKELLRLLDNKFLSKAQHRAVDPARICSFVNSDIGRRMLGSKRVFRETKFSVLIPAKSIFNEYTDSEDKVLLQGVIDLYFETENGIFVVDFKTDKNRPEGEVLAKYEEQLRTYATALYEITGRNPEKLLIYLVSRDEYIEFAIGDGGI